MQPSQDAEMGNGITRSKPQLVVLVSYMDQREPKEPVSKAHHWAHQLQLQTNSTRVDGSERGINAAKPSAACAH